MQTYRTKDLQRLLGVSPSSVRSLVRAGYLSPRRDRRGTLCFTFQDLVVVRAVRALAAARVPARRINRCLKTLRTQLPESAPLAGLSITAVGDQVAVSQGSRRWLGDSGQYLLALDVTMESGELRILEARPRTQEHASGDAGDDAEDCEARFLAALELEEADPKAALQAYRRCMALEPGHVGACINAGRLLHEAGRLTEAEAMYRRVRNPDATLLFNLGVLHEDLGREDRALTCYERAVAQDPDCADAHYNLARLYEAAGNPRESLRHLSAYRRLSSDAGH